MFPDFGGGAFVDGFVLATGDAAEVFASWLLFIFVVAPCVVCFVVISPCSVDFCSSGTELDFLSLTPFSSPASGPFFLFRQAAAHCPVPSSCGASVPSSSSPRAFFSASSRCLRNRSNRSAVSFLTFASSWRFFSRTESR